MPENQFLSVLRVWAAVAWADGKISAEEADRFRRLVSQATLGESQRQEALGFLETKVSLDTANIDALSDRSREGIYEAAARMAAADREFAAAEKTFLARLRTALLIPNARAEEIEKKVPGLS